MVMAYGLFIGCDQTQNIPPVPLFPSQVLHGVLTAILKTHSLYQGYNQV